METARWEILGACEAELQGMLAPGEPALMSWLLGQADQMVTEVVDSLRAGEPKLRSASQGVFDGLTDPPALEDFIQASSACCCSVLQSILRLAELDKELNSDIRLVVRVLEESRSRRLRELTERLRTLLMEWTLRAQESERTRISRELHDRIGYGLSVAYRNLELFHLHRDSDIAVATVKAEAAQKAVRDSMDQLRMISADLRGNDRRGSLKKALLHSLEDLESEGVSVQVHVEGDESAVPVGILDEVFLILREALLNALRHGRPRRLRIKVDISADEVRAMVDDDGRGFDREPLPSAKSIGLMAMAERARLLSGSVVIRSQVGTGTHVTLAVPLREEVR
ncbi:histidine kinase [Streptomyces sp. NBC_01485]|uniref:sensor histidine kinase n=1 Tax=Streptomyces sp. NBC_01485 TaxID=2903884 RepID=UPI002E2F1168|nr:ATP-binding protein [Streptomyces sp. NBC_01485]